MADGDAGRFERAFKMWPSRFRMRGSKWFRADARAARQE
jgi:hypothetical protein